MPGASLELTLTDDQVLFLDTTTRFIESELPLTATRAFHDHPVGFDRGWLQKAAELGWFTMLVPEAAGGGCISGQPVVDAAIVAEQLGRYVTPGPFVPQNVVAAALAELGTDAQQADLLPAVMAAETVAAWAFAAADGNWDAGAGVVARPTDGGYRLDGRRGVVQDAQAADVLLVAATVDGLPAQFLVPTDAPGLTVTELDRLDLSRRFAAVDFAAVDLPADARLGDSDATAALDRQLQIAVALACAETVGAMDALLTMTVEYSKDRVAFGRPIGSFQALKHIMADLVVLLEGSKAGTAALTRAVSDRAASAPEVTAMVAAYVGEAADELAQQALQIHGGIGYTWEHDLHLYMRRIRTNVALYGEPTWHREQLCRFHRLGEELPT